MKLLSYGERRQLELALALSTHPKVLFLDEPCAGLSPSERQRIFNMVRALPRDITVVMIEHDMDVALGLADRVTVMNRGRVMAEGTPAEVQIQDCKSATCISAKPSPTCQPLLTVSEIHTYYGDSYVLQGVSLYAAQGQIAAILGRNGMGKTTLIRSVAGLTPPRSGDIVYRGQIATRLAALCHCASRHRHRAAGPANLPLADRAREPAAADQRAGAICASIEWQRDRDSAGTSMRC